MKCSLPWLTKTSMDAIAAKHASEGTDQYLEMSRRCQDITCEEFQKHRSRIKSTMDELPRGSKKWWSLSKQLMHKKGKSPLFPPIKTSAGIWCRDPVTKANAFASCWAAKNQLPA